MSKEKTAILAGGCFWCVQNDLQKIPDVISVVSGYSGGQEKDPTYHNHKDHREAVLVTYDPDKTTFEQLVRYHITHIDPTDPDGSFFDRGEAYKSAVYYAHDEERNIAQAVIKDIDASGVYGRPLAVKVLPRTEFYPAEEEHQDYAKKNPLRYKAYRIGSGRDAFVKKHTKL